MKRKEIVYLGRSQLSRSRANLIQSLNTIDAFESIGIRVSAYLPSWGKKVKLDDKLLDLGILNKLNILSTSLLHPRWHFWPFIVANLSTLKKAQLVYTRVPQISIWLSKFGIKNVLEIHNINDVLSTKLGQDLLKNAKAGTLIKLIPISKNAMNMLKAMGFDESLLHIAPSGVNLSLYSSLEQFDASNLSRPRIVHIGKLNIDRGANVFEKLAQSDIADITIIGGEIDIANVRNLPKIPPKDVPIWYGKTDIVLLPYQPELATALTMSPIKLFEAMASGRPIIASDLPVIREVLTDNESALLVDAKNSEKWIDAVKRIQSDKKLAIKLANTAKENAKKYSWQMRSQNIAQSINLV